MRFRSRVKSLTRVTTGKRNKSRGEHFENLLMNCARLCGWSVIRIPDSCKQIGQNKIIRVRSPFDMVFGKNRRAIFVDAKSTVADRFNRGSVDPKQLMSLDSMARQGFKAGYIVFFSELNIVTFFSTDQLANIPDRTTLKPNDGVILGDRQLIELDRLFQPINVHNMAIDQTYK